MRPAVAGHALSTTVGDEGEKESRMPVDWGTVVLIAAAVLVFLFAGGGGG